ncbi:hypothetical protein [Thomasclavelia cocleata]|uniref:hypothetical protein n=1 Tax=Thomasclavelia cocleata TaxID=69824 RepID=UPI002430CCD9|nr:hypothetical protein [Thomasclavelia cocleata]
MEIYKLEVHKNIKHYHEEIDESNDCIDIVLGQFDFISLKEETYETFDKLFFNENIMGNYIKQSFLIYSTNNDQFIKNNKDNYAYRLVTLAYYNDSYYLKPPMNLSNQLFESDDVNYKVYNTLNNAAFVIVLFANDYSRAIKTLYDFAKINTKYSNFYYTILSINEFEVSKSNEEVTAQINLSIYDYSKIKNLIHDIINELKPVKYHITPLIGNKDLQIYIEKINIHKLLKIYNEYLKITTNDETKKATIYNVCTNILHELDSEDKIDEFFEIKEAKELDKDAYISLNYVHRKIAKIDEKRADLKSFINYLNHLKYNSFLKPLCLSIYPSLYEIVNRNDLGESLISLYCDEIYNITNIIMDTSLHTYHDPAIKPIQYFIPEKILNFYTCYLYCLKNELITIDGDGYKFDFLIKPVNEKHIKAISMQKETKPTNRIILIKLPIHQIFELDLVIFQLTHELAHFVGNSTRKREERLELFNTFFVDYIMDFLITDLNLTDEQNKKIFKYITDIVGRIISKVPILEINNYYLYNFRGICYDVTQYIQNNFDNINHYLLLLINEKESLDLFNRKLVSLFSYANDTFLVYGFEEIEYLCRECYADLVAINLLDCDFENYVSYFYRSCELNENYVLEDLDVVRISLVASIVYKDIDNLYNEQIEAGTQIKINEYINYLRNEQFDKIVATQGIRTDNIVSELKKYLYKCYSGIQELKINSNFIKELSEDFKTFTYGKDIDKIIEVMQKIIFKYYDFF